jgi:Na+-translocating ferredoxin:NAD+ oxidoreductase RnfC subunit
VTSATVTAIEKAGVVGAGGGGFPTHVKAAARADIVLANGAECEPLLRADTELVTSRADRVVRGLSLIREAVGAERAVVAFKSKNVRAFDAMKRALGDDPDTELRSLSNVYPAGDEFLLVFETTGRVVPESGIPLDVGVVVCNVTTLAQVADAVEGRPVTRRLVTVQGEVSRPATFDAPIGTDVAFLIDRAGGATIDEYAVVMGGPMMGRLMDPLGEPTTKTVSGLLVLPTDNRLVGRLSTTEAEVLRIARAACCQCISCTELCPRYLLGHDLEPHRTVRAIQYADFDTNHRHITSAFLCCECGMCELFACPLDIQPRRILSALKAELSRRGVPNPHVRKDLRPDDVREYRQIPTARLTGRLGLARYDGEAPLDPDPVRPKRVTLRTAQHVGAAARPVVQVGARVLEGDVVAEIPHNALGARVHASISGVVESVDQNAVVIVSADT